MKKYTHFLIKTFLTVCLIMVINASKVLGGQIHEAVKAGDLEEVKALLEANPSLLDSKDNTFMYYTPLHYACEFKQVTIANYLLDEGANINIKDEYLFTPLSRACGIEGQDTALIQRLIDMGSDVNLKGYNDLTPLHMAASSGNLEVAQLLINNGANVNAKTITTPGSGSFTGTVLQVAVNYYRNEEMAILLVENGANLNNKDAYGNTELHLAVLKGYSNLAKLLIENGADINTENTYNHTALYYAAKHGYQSVAQALIAAGANESTIEETNYGKAPQLSTTIKEGESYIWYLGNIGYAVKTKENLLLFNPSDIEESLEASLANGHLNPEELSGLKITILITAVESWEYDLYAYDLAKRIPGINVVLGFAPNDSIANSLNNTSFIVASPNESYTIDGIQVHTIPALCGGVGYLVEADGSKIFHAGLHVSDNSISNKNKYNKEIDFLKPYGPIDIAILSVHSHDGSLDAAYQPYLYLLDELSPQAVYLMGANTPEFYTKCVNILKVRDIPISFPEGGVTVGERFYYQRETLNTDINQLHEKKIEVFPNPTSQTIKIKGIDMLLSEVNYKLLDLNGKTIKQGKLYAETIDISELPKGIYILSLHTNKGIINKKIVIE